MRSGPWGFLLYLVLPHPVKMAVLSAELVGRLDRLNLAVNVARYSGSGASAYDQTHRGALAEHHEYVIPPLTESQLTRCLCWHPQSTRTNSGREP